MKRSAILKILSALAVLSLLVGAGVLALRQPRTAHAAATITLNGATTLQPIDGFGFSEAFGQAGSLESMSSGPRQQVLNLLFSPTSGAGFTILRNLLPSDSGNTIEPNSPGSPNTPPSYRSLGDSEGQVWMAQQAKSFGVPYLYGDAWSAPGYMKTNGTENNGGTLCGAPGAGCSSGDWRQAYANYLVQYAKDYQSAGVPLTELGAFNELNYTTNYSSMIMNPQQASDFIGVLGPTVRNAGLNLQVVCCDVLGWDSAQSYASALGSNGSDNIFSSHGYGGAPTFALTGLGSRHMWETEWSTFDGFNTNWDDGSDASGYTWAQSIYTGLTAANLSAFLYWWGASNGSDNQGLIQFNSGSYTVSARLWAFAQYSRFIRPGAVHVGTSTTDSNLMTFAARNSDGSYAIVVLNANRSDTPATFALQNAVSSGTATPYLTNGANSVAQQGGIGINGGSFSATIPARSLVTYRISGSNGGPTPTPTATTSIPTPTPTTTRSTPTPTPTVVGNTPTPTPTTTSNGNGVTATGVVASSSPWFSEEDLKFSGSSSITAMTATITVQKTAGVSYSGSYVTFGGATLGHTDNGSTITYTFTLNSGQSLSPGSYLDAAQFGGNGTVHPTSGDLWSITTTSNGVTSTQSGHF